MPKKKDTTPTLPEARQDRLPKPPDIMEVQPYNTAELQTLFAQYFPRWTRQDFLDLCEETLVWEQLAAQTDALDQYKCPAQSAPPPTASFAEDVPQSTARFETTVSESWKPVHDKPSRDMLPVDTKMPDHVVDDAYALVIPVAVRSAPSYAPNRLVPPLTNGLPRGAGETSPNHFKAYVDDLCASPLRPLRPSYPAPGFHLLLEHLLTLGFIAHAAPEPKPPDPADLYALCPYLPSRNGVVEFSSPDPADFRPFVDLHKA